MCFDLATLVDTKWLASLTEESAPAPVRQYGFKARARAYFEELEAAVRVPARVQADVFVLTIETELYAVMYDKRERIQQHALSQV